MDHGRCSKAKRHFSALVDQWAAGNEPIPKDFRAALTDWLLVKFFGNDERPGTWDRACSTIPKLKDNPLTDAFNRGKEWRWALGESRLRQYPDPAFIRFVLKAFPESKLLNYLRRESERQQSVGRKVTQGAAKGGKGKAGSTKVRREQVILRVKELHRDHPAHSDEQVYKFAAKQFGISARTVRAYSKKI
jgi:hypothetical protein